MPPFPRPEFEYELAVEQERAALREHRALRGIPGRSADHLLIATWRLHSFGVQQRTSEHIALIAEMLGWFDVIAIQGVDDGRSGLDDLKGRLRGYDYLLSTPGVYGLALLYDTAAVQFTGETGTIEVPARELSRLTIPGATRSLEGPPSSQFAVFERGPQVVTIVNVQIAYGGSKPEDRERAELEAFALSRWVDRRQRSPSTGSGAILAVGRMNLPTTMSDPVRAALESGGLTVPDHSSRIGGSIEKDTRTFAAALLPSLAGEQLRSSGVFDFDSVVFADLRDEADKRKFESLVRFALSDSRPVWYQLDFARSTAGGRDHVRWTGDEPARQDALGRRPVARVLAKELAFLRDETEISSFVVHIDGPWGAGKSTLLRFLREKFSEPDAGWLVVDFDAWRHSQVGPAWWALLHQLRATVSRHLKPHRRLVLWVSERYRLLAPSAVGLVMFLVGLAGLAVAAGLASSIGAVWTALLAVVSGLTTLWPMGRGIVRVLSWGSPRGAKVFEDVRANPMGDLASHFEWLLKQSPATVVFLIDDLDRCNQAFVVDLLDAIQTLMRAVPDAATAPPNKLFFVVAADGRWIRTSYEVAHAPFVDVVCEPARPLGYLFLDKLFQLTVPVPQLNRELRSSFLANLLAVPRDPTTNGEVDDEATVPDLAARLSASTSEDEVVALLGSASLDVRAELASQAVEQLSEPGVAAETEHVLQGYADLLDPNPRSMKRFLLSYSMNRAVRTVEGSAVDRDPLARWTILTIRWPELAERLRKDPEAIEEQDYGLPEALHDVLDDPAVREVASPLTPETIRASMGPGGAD
jgi:hypothetical protein